MSVDVCCKDHYVDPDTIIDLNSEDIDNLINNLLEIKEELLWQKRK